MATSNSTATRLLAPPPSPHPCRGIEQVLRKRLKNVLRREVLLKDPSPPSDLLHSLDTNPYHLDYLCLLDFEATCEGENPPDYIHEIIEFPVLLLNLKTLEIVSPYKNYLSLLRVKYSPALSGNSYTRPSTKKGCACIDINPCISLLNQQPYKDTPYSGPQNITSILLVIIHLPIIFKHFFFSQQRLYM